VITTRDMVYRDQAYWCRFAVVRVDAHAISSLLILHHSAAHVYMQVCIRTE